MAWRDNLRPASFRGVPFHVSGAGLSGGRRAVPHEYPDRDTPYVEDLGRGMRSYPIDAFVLGADYMEARDALLEALEAGGAGELVHPHLGAKSVVVDKFDLREGGSDGGLARFSITFLESGESLHPSGERDWLAAVDGQAASLTDGAGASFLDRFLVGGLPAFVTGHAEDLLGDLSGLFDQVAGPLLSSVEGGAAFARDIAGLATDAAALVQRPADLVARIVGLLGGISSPEVGRPRRATGVLQSLADWGEGAPAIPRTTSTRVQQDDNRRALIDLVREVATAQAVTTAARTEWPTHNEAVIVREALADRLDTIMDKAASDSLYLETQALRAELVQAVPPPDRALPRLSRYTPKATLPSLVVAYMVHGDATRADEIAARNRVRHPGFVPGGEELEIVNRG